MVNNTVDKLKKLQAEAQGALDEAALARQEERHLTGLQKFVHFWVLVARSFVRNRCPVRASALAYASLLAMVPMLAVVISVSSSLLKQQGEKPIEEFIEKMVASFTPQAAPTAGDEPNDAKPGDAARAPVDAKYLKTRKEIARNLNEFIGNVRSGTLGVTGMVALVFVAITMLSRIETTFNDIWGVTRGRTWFARVVHYWAAITLGPVLLALVLGLTSGPHFHGTRDLLAGLPLGVGRLLSFLFRFLPFVILSLAFMAFYQLMPNTKVHWRAALVGGIVGGSLWQINNMINVLYVSRVVTNSKIYGSLGMVPVFMVGLYFSWMIMLFGAQVAYAFQNRRTYLQEKQAEGVHQRSREFVALRLMTEAGLRFQQGQRPPTLSQLAETVAVPSRLAGQLLAALVEQRLLAEVVEGEAAYVPARPLRQITAQDIMQALRTGQGLSLATREDAVRAPVRDAFERIGKAEQATAETVTLEQLVSQASAAQTGA
jgi:membrane protein